MSIRATARDLYHTGYRLLSDGSVSISAAGVSATITSPTPIVRNRMRELTEPHGSVIERLLDQVEADDVFWDVGAHVGRYSCLVGQAVSETVAVEAHPKNMAVLGENLSQNDIDGTVFHTALADSAGTVQYEVMHDAPGEFLRGADIRDEVSGSSTRPVFAMTGDAMRDTLNLRPPDVLKIDVTGGEPEVLDGLEETLGSVRVAAVHEYPRRYECADAVRERLQAHGFEFETPHDRLIWAWRVD